MRTFNLIKLKDWRPLVIYLLVLLVPLLLLRLRSGPSHGGEKPPCCVEVEAPWLRRPAEERCSPQNNVGFLKTHKCGSSSIQSILLSYGMRNNLTFAVPEKSHIFDVTRPFLASDARGQPYQVDVANMFAFHAMWDHREVSKVLFPGSKFITIVREPTELYLSMFQYFQLHKFYKMPLEEVVDTVPRNTTRRNMGCLAYNSILCDLGAHPQDYDRPTTVRRLTAMADDYFDLVMVADRFDESLVLMCQLLCWSYKDVAFLNSNTLKVKESSVSPHVRERLKELQKPDYYVYNYFATKFDRLVEAYGRKKMSHEVDLLRKARSEELERCQVREVESQFVEEVEVRKYEANSNVPGCRNLVMPEWWAWREIKKKQLPENQT